MGLNDDFRKAMSAATNGEGMTWREWAAAAVVMTHPPTSVAQLELVRRARAAWRRSEDPTEWKASQDQARDWLIAHDEDGADFWRGARRDATDFVVAKEKME